MEKAKSESSGLGLFVRSLVGLDRQAAKKVLATFLGAGNLRATQIEFLDEIVNHLTENGCMDASRLDESPFTNFHPQAVEGVFTSSQIDELICVLADVRQRTIA